MPVAKDHAAQTSILRRWALFLLIGAVLYVGLYAGSEYLIYRHGEKNRFFAIKTAPPTTYDFAIVGASHAMPFDFADMNDRLQQASGSSILNLSIEGAGILPTRIILEYFFTKHRTKNVLLVIDSFAFYTPKWNEERIDDVRLFQRAPWDADLLRVLWRYPAARGIALNYASGFLKINNHDRFAPDKSDAEINKFTRTYRSIPQIDRQRVEYLYPRIIDQVQFQRYLAEFVDLVKFSRQQGANVIAVKPPTPSRYRTKLPNEAEFDSTLQRVLAETGVPYVDLSTAVNEDRFFYDTDHLNRAGVMTLIDGPLGELLRRYR